MRKPKNRYGIMRYYGSSKWGKVHKTGNKWDVMHNRRSRLSKCGGAVLDKKFNSIKKYSESELCKRCFRGEQLNSIKFQREIQKVLHMEEDLFRL